MTGINTGQVSDPVAPFGGVKESAFGREGGRHGIEEFQSSKVRDNRYVEDSALTNLQDDHLRGPRDALYATSMTLLVKPTTKAFRLLLWLI